MNLQVRNIIYMSDKYQIDPNKVDKLANLAIKVGLGLQKGQNLIITAPI